MKCIFSFLIVIICSQAVYAGFYSCDKGEEKPVLYGILNSLSCQTLPVGKSKIVNVSDIESPTTVQHKYILEHPLSHLYKVKLNLVLQENTLRAKRETVLCQKMRKKINECLEEINQHLLGPNGQKIKIEILEPTEENQQKYAEIANVITVDSEPIERANSGFYSLQTSCSTIAHELLHLTGLVDEYREELNIPAYDQDCRSVGPDDSIMHNHHEAIDTYFSTDETSFITQCQCENSNHCPNFSDSEIAKFTVCPNGFREFRFLQKSKMLVRDKQSSVLQQQDIGFSAFQKNPSAAMFGMNFNANARKSFVLKTEKSGRVKDSYLYPAHFRVITAPLCYDQNMTYYLCSRDAYHWPFKWFGSCHERPAACNDPLAWLR